VDLFYAVARVIARFWIWFFFERVVHDPPPPCSSTTGSLRGSSIALGGDPRLPLATAIGQSMKEPSPSPSAG
jgi:hypothetical protein